MSVEISVISVQQFIFILVFIQFSVNHFDFYSVLVLSTFIHFSSYSVLVQTFTIILVPIQFLINKIYEMYCYSNSGTIGWLPDPGMLSGLEIKVKGVHSS